MEIGVGDFDQSSTIKMHKIVYPNKLATPIEADSQQRLVIKFSLGGRIVHQAFVRLECQETKREVIFVAEVDNGGLYKFDLVSKHYFNTFQCYIIIQYILGHWSQGR